MKFENQPNTVKNLSTVVSVNGQWAMVNRKSWNPLILKILVHV